MAANIYGYQGVHTPLESVTQGRYTLADYTAMRTELTSRLIALENQGGFVPTNVEITGYLHMLPGGQGNGEIETTSSITGESLYINSLAQCGSVECNGNLTVGGAISAASATINGVTMQGSLNMNLNNITNAGSVSAVSFSGNGSSLTSVAAATCPYSGLTGIVPTWNQNTTGNAATATTANDPNKLPLAGGTLTGNLTVQAGSKYFGDGSSLTGITASDPTKMPLAGGVFTGEVSLLQGLSCEAIYTYDQAVGATVVPPLNRVKYTTVLLQFQNTCTVNLANYTVATNYFSDHIRYVTIVKSAVSAGGFAVSVVPPVSYTMYSVSGTAQASFSIPVGTFSATFLFYQDLNRIYVVNLS